MHTLTKKAERDWDKAKRAVQSCREALKRAEHAMQEAEAAELKARHNYQDFLACDGVDFDERQDYRTNFRRILSALPS